MKTEKYDDNGNLINDGTYKYYYDCENRLTDVNNQSNQPIASYSYDYLGRRVKKIVYGSPDVTIKYCYDGDQVIAETENDGATTLNRRFYYGPGIDELIAMRDMTNGKSYFYHYDGLGNVIALSDVNGVLLERYEYDVFGKPTIRDASGNQISESQVGNPYMFTGRRYDDKTGLYYYRYRYYSPEIGRFLQPDPIYYAGGLNLYTYVWNNPINFVDPYGLWALPGWTAGPVGAIGDAAGWLHDKLDIRKRIDDAQKDMDRMIDEALEGDPTEAQKCRQSAQKKGNQMATDLIRVTPVTTFNPSPTPYRK